MGHQRVSTEMGWLGDRIDKREPPSPIFRLAEVQIDTSYRNSLKGKSGVAVLRVGSHVQVKRSADPDITEPRFGTTIRHLRSGWSSALISVGDLLSSDPRLRRTVSD